MKVYVAPEVTFVAIATEDICDLSIGDGFNGEGGGDIEITI